MESRSDLAAYADAPAGTYGDIDSVLVRLREARHRWRAAHRRNAEHGAAGFPSRHDLAKIMEALCGALFPLRLGPSFVRLHNEDAFVEQTLRTALSRIYGQIRLELAYSREAGDARQIDEDAGRIIAHFAEALPALRTRLDEDVEAAFSGDPAARSVDEVLICYPSLTAIVYHRLAHRLHGLGAPLVARIIAENASVKTGIDIHPAARIGGSFFIDHGAGVVIGETAIVGDRVRLYQGVTLGGPDLDADAAPVPRRGLSRHPTIEDDVVIHAGAVLLGPITVGRGSVIGSNVSLSVSVPPGSRVDQARAHRLARQR